MGWIVKTSVLMQCDGMFDESIDLLQPDTLLLAEQKVTLDTQWLNALDEVTKKSVLERIDEWTVLYFTLKE